MKKIISIMLALLMLFTLGSTGFCFGYETYEEASAWHRYVGFDLVSYENPTAEGGELVIKVSGRNLSQAKELKLVLTPRNSDFAVIEAAGVITKSSSDMLPVAVNNVPVDYLEVERNTVEFTVTLPANNTTESILYDIDTYCDGQRLRDNTPLMIPANPNAQAAEKKEMKWSDTSMKVAVNGENISFPDQKPMYDDNTGRTYVPVRFLAENLGAEVDWDEDYQVVEIVNKYIEGADTKAVHRLKIGENKFVSAVYGDSGVAERIYSFYLPADIYPIMVNDRIMLPFRYVAELLGSQVYYDNETSTAHCIKRDMSDYTNDSIIPVLSTVLGEYFAEEVSAYRKEMSDPGQLGGTGGRDSNTFDEAAEVGFNGTLADIAVWCCFDHIEHPEWYSREYHYEGWAHVHSTSILNEDYGVYEGDDPYAGSAHATAHGDAAFGRKWLDGRLPLGPIAFGENQAFHDDFRRYGGDDNEASKAEYYDLAENWGIKIKEHKMSVSTVGEFNEDKTEIISKEVTKEVYNTFVNVYNEQAYRDICGSFISQWAHSTGHDAWMKSLEFDDVALGYVGDRGYMTMAGYSE